MALHACKAAHFKAPGFVPAFIESSVYDAGQTLQTEMQFLLLFAVELSY